MLALTLLALLSSTDGKVAIVERTTLGIPAGSGAALRQRLRVALGAAGLEAELVSPACADRECLTALARTRGACVVGVTLVKNKKGLTVDLEAVDAAAVVLQQTFLLANEQLERSPEAQVFAYQLGTRLAKDRPVVEPPPPPKVLTPGLVEAPPPWLEPSPAPSRVAPRVLGGVAGGLGAAAIGLLVASAVVKGQLDTALREPVVTSLTRIEAQQQADLANGLLGGSVVALGLGLASGATALVLGLD